MPETRDLQKKRVASEKLKQKLARVLSQLANDNALLKAGYGPGMESHPVTLGVRRLARIFQALRALGETPRLDLTHWTHELIMTLSIDPYFGPMVAQRELKLELLKKHGDPLNRKPELVIGSGRPKAKPVQNKPRKRLP